MSNEQPKSMTSGLDPQSWDAFCSLVGRYWCKPLGMVSEVNASPLFRTNAPDPQRPVRRVAVYFYSFGLGGGEVMTAHTIARLVEAGLTVTLFTDLPPAEGDLELPQGVERVVLGDSNYLDVQTVQERGALLSRELRQRQIDVILFNHWWTRTLEFDVVAARALGIRCYCLMQSSLALFFQDPIMANRGIPWTYDLLDGMACLSSADAAWLSHYNGNVRQTINPITISASTEPAPLAGHVIIWPARVHADKQPLQAVEILALVRKQVPDAALLFVGPIDEETGNQVTARAEELGVAQAVELCGPQVPESMATWYRKADAYLLTSRGEGWCMALGEAMACGLPCVMYEMPYLTLTQGNDAILAVRQGDVEAAADALVLVLQDKQRAHEMAHSGRAFIAGLERYDYAGFWQDLFASSALHGNATTSQELESPERMAWDVALNAQFNRLLKDLGENYGLTQQNRGLSQRVEQLQAQVDSLQHDLESTRGSASFKLGRTLTALPRKLRDGGQR